MAGATSDLQRLTNSASHVPRLEQAAQRAPTPMYQVSCLAPHELSAPDRGQWRTLSRSAAMCGSPLLACELFQLAGELRDDLGCAVVRDGAGTAVAFLPFARQGRSARPYLRHLADLHGVIGELPASLDPRDLLRACDLRSFSFSNFVTPPECWRAYCVHKDAFPYVDLSDGYEAYEESRKQIGSRELRETLRKSRKLNRERGPLRFELQSHVRQHLEQLLRWKADQLNHQGHWNGLSIPWVERLFERLLDAPREGCQGVLSTLLVGEVLAAATFGVRLGNVLHGWVTCYNPAFARYSPGSVLLAHLFRAAPPAGIARIDMGSGPEAYKRTFASGEFPVWEGAADTRPAVLGLRQGWLRTRKYVRQTTWGRHAEQWLQQFRSSLKTR